MRLRHALPWVLASAALAQQPGPEEVRTSSRPYMPFQLRAESTIVQIGVVVRDGKGRSVSGLQKDDFKLTDQGKDRGITSFTVDTRDAPGGVGVVAAKGRDDTAAAPSPATDRPHPPRFIALFFDDIGTAAGDMARMKRDATRFIEDGMAAGDRLAVVASSTGRISDFLIDKKQIEDAIGKVQSHPRFPPGGNSPCPRMTPYDAYLISNYLSEQAVQAKMMELPACSGTPPAARPRAGTPHQLDPLRNIIQQLAEEMWQQVRVASMATMDALAGALADLSARKGTRMLLLVSSGFLTGTMEETVDSLADRALRAGVVINGMDAKGLYVESPLRPFGEAGQMENSPVQVTAYETMTQNAAAETATAVMADLAQATGGLFFHHNNDFSFGFRELGSVPEITYLIGFHPDDATLDGKYHKLKVRLASSNGYSVEARPGYFATPRSAPAEDKGRAELDRQVMTSQIVQQFPAAVQMQLGARNAAGATPVRVQMHVDLNGLTFGQQDGRHIQKLTFVFALFDGKDSMVTAREGSMEFALTDARFKSLQQSGINAALTLEAPSGEYRLRAVAVEGGQGQIAAQVYRIQVP